MKQLINLEDATAYDVIAFGAEHFGDRITFASSFGAEDVVLIDMISKINPNMDIFFLDTDLHFKETYDTIKSLEAKYLRSFTRVKTKVGLELQAARYGPELWNQNPDQCCHIRKVEPLTNYLLNFEAWITGIRREQSPTRTNAKKIEKDQKFDLIKINPLVDWTLKDVWSYIHKYNIPYNPLHDHNYPSIGCLVCTKQVLPGQDIRSGRWGGYEKTECGLHK